MNRTIRYSSAPQRITAFFKHLIILVSVLAALATPPCLAGVDAVLVMDSSGSMAKNDPKKLRVPAAKMFMSLLGDRDRIGLISFSDNGYPVLHLTAPGPKTNARILASADKVSSKGVYTNLHAALAKGVDMLEREGQPGQEKMLVLMSDGKMDVGDTDEDWALTQKVQGELLESIRDKGIKVYTIAFTEASDVELLRELAHQSGALFKLARTDQDLHEVFSAIFESAKHPDMLPVEGGEFVVDSTIEEVTIVASKEREDVRIYLQSPDGRKLSADDAGDQLKWFLSHHFDMITLYKPEPGTWKLLFTGGKNRAYIVTNMALNHNPQQPHLNANEDMVLESWLEQDGKLLDKEAVLTNTRFRMSIQDPSGATASFDLFDSGEFGDRKPADGRYSNTLSYQNPGSYRISIIAESETFQRQKTVHLDVVAPPAELATAKPEPDVVPETEQQAAPPPESESPPEVEPQAEPDTEPEATAEDAADTDEPPAQAAPKKKKGVGMGVAIGIFAAVNLLLVAIGLGVWWFLKKRNKGSVVEEADEADAEEN
ncbi:VWA domain-containing protein [Thiogranum longum]